MIAYGEVGHAYRPYVLERDVLVDGHAIRRAEVASGGVAIDVTDASRVKANAPIAFVLDGRVHGVVTPDQVGATQIHVVTPGDTEDAAIAAALELVDVVEAGAAHPLHVESRDSFTRATGFLPRAWPFFAVFGVMVLVAGVIGRRTR